METLLNDDLDASPLSNAGMKRKVLEADNLNSKRIRLNDNTSDNGLSLGNPLYRLLLIANLGSDASSYEDVVSTGEPYHEHQADSSAATPLTPISSKASPRYPSDLVKSHHCPYPECDKSFNRPAKLTQHLRSHTNTRPFVCPHPPCPKDFLRESHLKHHVKSAHSDIRDYICDWEGCGKSFITATRLRRHQATHEGKEKFRCEVPGCGETFRKHTTLQKHVTIVHEGKDPFVCTTLDEEGQECGAGFDTEGKLNSHVGRVHGEKRFLCTMCPPVEDVNDPSISKESRVVTFPTHAALQAHFASEHPPTCTDCGLQCTSQSALKSHIEVIHGGFDIDERRIHICQEPSCGRGFTKKGNLNAHFQICHTGKRFICGEVDPKNLNRVGDWDGSNACGEALKSKANLEKHIRGVHLGLEPSGKAKKKGLRSPPKRLNQVSTLTKLTGSGYETDSGRDICCLLQGCSHRFVREYDLEIHLQSQHHLSDLEVQEILVERECCNQPEQQRFPSTTAERGFEATDRINLQDSNDIEMDAGEKFNGGETSTGADSWPGMSFSMGETSGDGFTNDGEWEIHSFPCQNDTANGYRTSDGGDIEMIDPSLF